MLYEEKAAKYNDQFQKSKVATIISENGVAIPASPNTNYVPHIDYAYYCLWDNCDFQFEDIQDLAEHCIHESIYSI